jgi:hypothetical protein
MKAILRLMLPPEAADDPIEGGQTTERVLQLNKLKTGRPASWRLNFNGPGNWTLLGTMSEVRRDKLRDDILRCLEEEAAPMS